MASAPPPPSGEALRQLEEYREQQRRRERGESPAPQRRTPEPSAPPASLAGPEASRAEQPGSMSLYEEMLAHQRMLDEAGVSDEELVGRLGAEGPNPEAAARTAPAPQRSPPADPPVSLPGGFPMSPTDGPTPTSAAPAPEPGPAPSAASALFDGVRSALGYFLPSVFGQQVEEQRQAGRPPQLARINSDVRDRLEYDMVSPSEARDYRPVDPSSEYQDYYGLPPPPSPVRPPFQFSVTYGPRPPFPLFGDPFARPTMGFPFPDFDAPPFPTAPGAFRQYPPPPGPPPDLFSLLGFPPGFGPAFGIPAHDPSDPVAQRVAQGMPASYEELMSLAERMGGGGPRGASREVIDGLPRVPAPAAAAQSKGKEKPGGEGGSASASGGSSSSSAGGAAGSEERQTSCPVCLGAFGEEPGEQLVVLPKCLHKYHEPCAIAALERDRRCPVCRVDV